MGYFQKTRPDSGAVGDFLASLPDPRKRAEAETLISIMQRVSGEPAVLWGPSIIGFGRYHYRYASGHEGESPRLGFSPRKAALTIYIVSDYGAEILARLGRHTTSKSCLYVKRLSDIDLSVLEELLAANWAVMEERYRRPPT